MANTCCQEYNTECNKIVTIGYLKTFVGNNIQNSSGAVVAVNDASGDTYCPTYSELVGGSIVPKHVASGWSGDVDGIVVGGSYSNGECVKQSDLSLVFTRFKSITASASKTSVSECGEAVTMSSTYTLARTTKSMNGSCAVASSTTNGNASSSAVSYTSSQSFATVSNSTVTFAKNGTVSSSTRSANITAKVTFRGTAHSATTVTITQAALTGDYTNYVSAHNETTSVVATASTATQFGCSGGTYRATAVANYNRYATYAWVDSCGTIYSSRTNDVLSGTGSTSLAAKSGTFPVIDPCDRQQDYHSSVTLSFTDGGKTDSITFKQDCLYDASQCGCQCEPTYAQRSIPNVAGTGGTASITWDATYANGCDGCTAFTVNTNVEIGCNSGASRNVTGTYNYSGKSLSWRVSQASGTPEDCGVCTYTCNDVLGVTAHTIPANPTGDVLIFSYEFDNRYHVAGGKYNGIVFYYDGTNHVFTGNSDNAWVFSGSSTGGIYHSDVYLPSRYIQENTGSTSRTETLRIKAYVCADERPAGGKTGYDNMPASVACSPSALTLTQAGAECNITSVSCNPASAYLSDSITSVTTVVTVQGTGGSCAKTWTATVRDSSVPGGSTVVIGNNGESLTVKEAQTVTIRSLEDNTKSCTFVVDTAYANKVSLSVNVSENSMGQGMPYVQVQALTGSTYGVSLEGDVVNGNSTYPFSISLNGSLGTGDYQCGNFGSPVPSFETLAGGQITNLRFINTPSSFDPSSMLSAGRIDNSFRPSGVDCS